MICTAAVIVSIVAAVWSVIERGRAQRAADRLDAAHRQWERVHTPDDV